MADSGQPAPVVRQRLYSGLCRVRIAGADRQVDVALAADVPFAELLPDVLDALGAATGSAGWVLTRPDGTVLDAAKTPDALHVLDGERLVLVEASTMVRPVVFDDLVDAVAAEASSVAGPWSVRASRCVLLAVMVCGLLGGLAVVPLSGMSPASAATAVLTVAVLALAAATVLHRAIADRPAGVALGLVAVAYAAIGGLLLVSRHTVVAHVDAAQVLLAATLAIVAAAAAAMAVDPAWFAPVVGMAAGPGVGALLCLTLGRTPVQAAAVVLAVALVVTPVLPTLAIRMSRLPLPTVPVSVKQMFEDDSASPTAIRAATALAHNGLAGLLIAASVVCVGSSVVLVTGDWSDRVLVSVAGLLLLVLARGLRTVAQRLPVLVGGLAGLFVAAGALVVDSGGRAGPAVALAPILLAVACLALRLRGERRLSPYWRRLVDLIGALLAMLCIVLAAWCSGVYSWIGSLVR